MTRPAITGRGTPSEYMTTRDFADLTGFGLDRQLRMRRAGTLRFLKTGRARNAQILYLRSDVAAWLEGRTFESTVEQQLADSVGGR